MHDVGFCGPLQQLQQLIFFVLLRAVNSIRTRVLSGKNVLFSLINLKKRAKCISVKAIMWNRKP